MQSPWYTRGTSATRARHRRAPVTPVPYILAAESDLVRAEALIRKNGPIWPRQRLSSTTRRVTRGKLPPQLPRTGTAAARLYRVRARYRDCSTRADSRSCSAVTSTDCRPVRSVTFQFRRRSWRHSALPIYTFGGVGKPDMNLMLPSGELTALRSPVKAIDARSDSRIF